MRLTMTATRPPAALATNEYSPSPRQIDDAPLHGVVVPMANRGSKAQAAPGWTAAGEVNVCAISPVVPASGVKVRLGVTAVAPMFCATIVLTRPTPPAFFAAYGP